MVEQWPHANPPNASAWISSIANAFEGYPLGVVAECVHGLARSREFPPTVKAVADWCDARLQHHRNWAAYVPVVKRLEKPDPPVKHKEIEGWLIRLGKWLSAPKTAGVPTFKSRGPNSDELREHYPQHQQAAE